MKISPALIILCIATTLLCAAPVAQDSGAAEADGPRAGVWEQRRSFLRGRIYHSAVWTGEGMLIYGGSTGGVSAFDETHHYRPAPALPPRESVADR